MSWKKLLALIPLLCLLVIVSAPAAPLVAKGQPPPTPPVFRASNGRVYGLGFRPTPAAAIARSRRLVIGQSSRALPASVDLSSQMPPVGDQGSQESGVAWATTYYCKTLHEAKEQGWSVATTNHQYSPAWTFNQINSGWNWPASIQDAFELLKTKGATTVASQPYNENDWRTWPTLAQYLEAMPARIQDYSNIFWGAGNGGAALTAMKTVLAAGYPVVLGFPIYSDFNDIQPPFYIYDGVEPGSQYQGSHAVCLVGYDDNIAGLGGFKFRNSWGTSWGNNGSAYLSYDFVSQWADEAWSMTERVGYVPQAWAKVLINHTWRGDLLIELGHGSEGAPDWSVIVYAYQGGSADNVNTYVDVTDAGTVIGDWWLRVTDSAGGDQGTLNAFTLIKGSAEIVSPETPQTIADNSTIVAHLAWTLEQYVLRALTGPGGTPLSAQNYVTVNYTAGGDPASAQLWEGNDATVLADNGAMVWSATSSGSGANQRWMLPPSASAAGARGGSRQQLLAQTYYHQLRKTFATHTNAAPLLGPGNYATVTYQDGGAPVTAHAYDGLTAAVWADRGGDFSYSTTSSASNAKERWAAPQAFAGTVTDNATETPDFWHQYKPTLTLNGTEAGYATEMLQLSLFGQQALPTGLFGQWSDWVDARTTLKLRHYTTGSPRRLTFDATEWFVESAFSAVCNFQSYFAIVGTIRDADHNPLPEVTVQVGDVIVTTNALGFYQVRDLPAGAYTVVPSKVGWSFHPANRAVTVNATTGDARG